MPPVAEPRPPSAGPACRRCGSGRLRRPHSRNRLERFLRRNTRWDRYACVACGDRGWLREAVPEGDELLAAATPAHLLASPGRPLEVRDLRARREATARGILTVLVALLLGAAAALFLQRCGGAGVPGAP